ncbi:MAG: PAS domain-containing protein [Myxococcales bacterium]|nr:PAS domain-containing protein [Myxococcales bacterium]
MAEPDRTDDGSRERRAAGNETVLEGQKKALELALGGAPLSAVLDVIVRTVEAQSSSGVSGSILLYDAEAKRLRHGAAPSLPAEYNAAIDGIAVGPAVGSCGTAAFTGKTVIATDIETDPLWASFRDLARKHELRACWSTPILSSKKQVLGTFALYHRVPATPTARDREIVDLLGHSAALVIERDHEARRRAAVEAELRAARDHELARAATLFEHAPAAIAMLRGPEHVFEVANPKYGELVGPRELLGKSIRQAFPELAGQGIYELLDGVRTSGEPFIGRSLRVDLRRSPTSAPEEGYFDFVYQPIPDGDGKVDGILVVAFEVTALVRAKAAADTARARAEASEQALKTFIDNLPELAWTAQPDGHIDYYNRRWYEYTGTTFEEMQGWGWEKVHDPALLPKVVERWKHSLSTGEPFEMEFTLRGADGVARWFLTRVAPMRDASGAIVRWFGTNTNIHEIKAASALSEAMAQQSFEMQRALLEMRGAKERAELRVSELEAERRASRG